ncbi:hypothetical protein Tco_0209779 [Tanacetum coccineum]
MPSTPGGIESSCSRNASISSIRKSLPPKDEDGELESIIRKCLSITNFEGHRLVIVSKGHLFTGTLFKALCLLKKASRI